VILLMLLQYIQIIIQKIHLLMIQMMQ